MRTENFYLTHTNNWKKNHFSHFETSNSMLNVKFVHGTNTPFLRTFCCSFNTFFGTYVLRPFHFQLFPTAQEIIFSWTKEVKWKVPVSSELLTIILSLFIYTIKIVEVIEPNKKSFWCLHERNTASQRMDKNRLAQSVLWVV